MDLSLGTIQIPVALLNVFNTLAVLLSIPILDRVVYPCFQRIGRPMRYMHRIGKNDIFFSEFLFLYIGLVIFIYLSLLVRYKLNLRKWRAK